MSRHADWLQLKDYNSLHRVQSLVLQLYIFVATRPVIQGLNHTELVLMNLIKLRKWGSLCIIEKLNYLIFSCRFTGIFIHKCIGNFTKSLCLVLGVLKSREKAFWNIGNFCVPILMLLFKLIISKCFRRYFAWFGMYLIRTEPFNTIQIK